MLALKGHLDIPLDHVLGATVDPEVARGFHGLRLPGTYLPGIITAGTFYDGDWLFFDVRDPERAVQIDLDHEHDRSIIVEVDDPAATVAAIRAPLGDRSG